MAFRTGPTALCGLVLGLNIQNAFANEPESPVLVNSTFIHIVPVSSSGSIEAAGLSFGTVNEYGGTLEMSFAYSLDNVNLKDNLSEAEDTWMAGIKYRLMLGPSRRANLFLTLHGGFIAGDRVEEDEDNMLHPFAQLGFGLRFLSKSRNGRRVFVAPEWGMMPGSFLSGDLYEPQAFTVGFSVGVLSE